MSQRVLTKLKERFGAAIVERLKVLGYKNVQEVNFGGASPDPHQLNMRALMWNATKDWLLKGAIDKNDERLAIDLASAGYHINRSGKLVIEGKEELVKRLGHSPDDADALVLTFARPVALGQKKPPPPPQAPRGYAPFG